MRFGIIRRKLLRGLKWKQTLYLFLALDRSTCIMAAARKYIIFSWGNFLDFWIVKLVTSALHHNY